MNRQIVRSMLTWLAISSLPATAFACINKMTYTYAAATLDHLIFAPLVASGIIVVLRNRGSSTMPRELAVVVASFVGALGVGLIFGVEAYRWAYLPAVTVAASVPLALTLIDRDGPKWAQVARKYLLAAAFVISGLGALFFGLTAHHVELEAVGFQPADPAVMEQIDF